MNKADLVEKAAAAAGLTKTETAKALEAINATIVAAVKAGDKVTLVGFGTYSSVSRAARTGRNPQTGAALKISAKKSGKFTPGKDLKDL
jgi:DNA-binding protein HU-beta